MAIFLAYHFTHIRYMDEERMGVSDPRTTVF